MPNIQEPTGKAIGGTARAESLTPEERSSIAKKAAATRWDNTLPVAICGSTDKPLRIGDAELQCYVLDDGTRVLSQAEFLEALGRHRKANVRKEGGEERLPAILQGKAINPFISDETLKKSRPIKFRTPSNTIASGYRAEILPEVCEIYLKARDAGVLPKNQEHVAKQAEILIRGLAHVGIIALVDEATGFQSLRAKDSLARILEAFVAKELQPYVSRFKPIFYQELFRLRKLEFPNDSIRRPQYFGHLTNDIIYRRLAPGVWKELKAKVQKDEKGRSKHKLFQHLTREIGDPRLRDLIASVTTIMRLSNSWDDFKEKLDSIHPAYNETMPLPLELKEDSGEGI